MNAKVFYHSQTGNTAKIAQAMAKAIGSAAEAVGPGADGVKADVLFLGAAVYATHDHGLAPAMLEFIKGLNPSAVKQAVVFATGFPQSDARGRLKGLLEGRGIKVRPETFFCPGHFLFFQRGHPNAEDLRKASEFASAIAAG